MNNKIIKIVLSILFFLCLLDMPYGYYQLVRFLALAGFSYLSFYYYRQNNQGVSFIYAMLAVLFQPLLKISLGREIWNIIDVVVGLGLIISLFAKSKKS
ncbi:hypothetical protein SanaruYs_39470 [Chryseotalea sanaruensis]|uniref:Uncharacterized protein n=1 Tax=Chryseotalea sanaruensis TaxID=2482724 RepID=A0A401UFQ2_9BACT|nr:hypothetical protein SanaruYs_39470 [Chryseotalea sanaruensis]